MIRGAPGVLGGGAWLVPRPPVPGENKHQGTGALPSRAAKNNPETTQFSGPQGWKLEMSKAGTVHELKPL